MPSNQEESVLGAINVLRGLLGDAIAGLRELTGIKEKQLGDSARITSLENTVTGNGKVGHSRMIIDLQQEVRDLKNERRDVVAIRGQDKVFAAKVIAAALGAGAAAAAAVVGLLGG